MSDFDLDYPFDYPEDDLETQTVEEDRAPRYEDPVTGQDYDGLDWEDFYPERD